MIKLNNEGVYFGGFMSSDKQIPAVYIKTLLERGCANYAQEKNKDGKHNLLSITTDKTGQSTAVVSKIQHGTFVVKHGATEQKKPFVYKQNISTYTKDGYIDQAIPVEETSDLQKATVASLVQSTDGVTMSLSYERPVIFNEAGACADQFWQAVDDPIRIAILDTNTNETLGYLTYPPLAQEQIGIAAGHIVVQQGDSTFTIDARMTMPMSEFHKDYKDDVYQASSVITVNSINEDLLSGKRNLLDAPQLLLQNFGAITQISILPTDDGHWDLAVMGYAQGDVVESSPFIIKEPQILVIKDVLSQKGVIDATQNDPALSVINFQKSPNYDSNRDNRIVQVHLNDRRYLALATQNPFYCDQDQPLWLVDLDELEAISTPLTLGDNTASVTQIALFSTDPDDCFGLHALNVANNGTESLTISSIGKSGSFVYTDRIYVVEKIPSDIAKGKVNEIAIQNITAFMIVNAPDRGAKDCPNMGLELKGSSPFIPTDNPLLASSCSNEDEDEDEDDLILIIDFAASRKLAFENVIGTDPNAHSTEIDDSDPIGMEVSTISEIAAEKERKNIWFSAGLMGLSSILSSVNMAAQALLGENTPSAAIDRDNPVQIIDCSPPTEEPDNFTIGLAATVGAATLLAAVGLFAFTRNKFKSEETYSADEETCPADKETYSTDEETCPTDEEAYSTDEETAPLITQKFN